MKKIGGATFCWNAISQDYCIIETLECLYELCDEISIAYGGTDGTEKLIVDWINSKPDADEYPGSKEITRYRISGREWDEQQGREKLSYFSNIAIANLRVDFFFYLQADEILHESSFDAIRQCAESDQEAFLVLRINCWASPYWFLDVPQNRKPVSTEIVRMGKPHLRCVDDAESLGNLSVVHDTTESVRIYHMGFVRDKKKHIDKIIHMQKDVFLMDYDKRVHDCEDGFDPWKFGFSPEDIKMILEPLPKFIQAWAKERSYDVFHDDKTAELFLDHVSRLLGVTVYHGNKFIETANAIIRAHQ
jgi:hypothetical protein